MVKYKVKMLQSVLGVDDGNVYPTGYQQGGEYEIGADLYSAFVRMGAIELVGNVKIAAAPAGDGEPAAPDFHAMKRNELFEFAEANKIEVNGRGKNAEIADEIIAELVRRAEPAAPAGKDSPAE
jgi:hypothetical protein